MSAHWSRHDANPFNDLAEMHRQLNDPECQRQARIESLGESVYWLEREAQSLGRGLELGWCKPDEEETVYGRMQQIWKTVAELNDLIQSLSTPDLPKSAPIAPT